MYKKALLTFLFFLFFIFPTKIHAAAYYVAEDGDNSNSGTEAQPFLTVTVGVAVLSAGDTLYVKAGTYTEALQDIIPSGTSWNNPVTVAAFTGDSPILKPSSTNRVLYFSGGDDSYIVVDGFVLDGTDVIFETVKITTGSNNIRIKNTEIKNSPGSGILVTQSGSDNNEFLNLTIYDNGSSGLHHGIYIQTDNNLISGSEIYSNSGHGIHLFSGDPDNNIIRNNNIYSNSDRGIGIYVGSGNLVYNNILRNQYRGIEVAHIADGTGVYNNTIFSNTDSGIQIDGTSNTTTISNNIVNNNPVGIRVEVNATGVTLKNNLIAGNGIDFTDASSSATSTDNLFTAEADNPRFVNPIQNNFALQAVSPAVDAGITVSTVTTDYNGTARPKGSAYDIGAYEYSAASVSIPTLVSATTSKTTYSETFTYNGSSVSVSSPTTKLTQTATRNAFIGGNKNRNILEFSGKAPANALVSVELVNSKGETIPGIIKVGSDGTWTWKPPLRLDPGNYTITFTTQDEKGNTGSTTLKFTTGFNFFGKIWGFINNTLLSLFSK